MTDLRVRLSRWLAEQPIGVAAPIEVLRLSGGRSNPTYRVTTADGVNLLLRTPPPGTVLATAHDVLREARIQRSLGGTGVPVANVLATCEDSRVIGVPFMVSAYVDGIVLRDRVTAEQASHACRERVGLELVDALAALHAVDPGAVGLGDLASGPDYVARQVGRWMRQMSDTGGPHRRDLLDLGPRVGARVPAQRRVAIVHGDPKLDNCIVADDGRLLALVDWELSTLGDPLADLALMLAYWAEPGDDEVALQDPPTRVDGFAGRADLVARYAAATGSASEDVDAYVAFSFWKLACIVAGVVSRLESAGAAPSERVAAFHEQVERLARLARTSMAPHDRKATR